MRTIDRRSIAQATFLVLPMTLALLGVLGERGGAAVPSAESEPLGTRSHPATRYGSWRSPIKSTSSDPADYELPCTAAGLAWSAHDPVAIVDALVATNQSVYGVNLSDFSGWIGACQKSFLEEIAQEVALRGEDIDVVGAFQSNFDTLGEIVTATEELRLVSEAFPEVTAMTYDDFHTELAVPWNPYDTRIAPADVAEIYDAAHPGGHEIDFTPYLEARRLSTFIVPGFFLGVRGYVNGQDDPLTKGDFNLYPQDRIALVFDFDTPDRRPTPYLTLSFLLRDVYELSAYATDRYPALVVSVNGTEIAEKNLSEDWYTTSAGTSELTGCPAPGDVLQHCGPSPYMSLVEAKIDLSLLAHPGETNELTFALTVRNCDGTPATSAIAAPNHKLAILSDIRLESPFASALSPSISLGAPTPDVHRPGGQSEAPSVVFARDNSESRIDESIDGLWLKYTSRTRDIDLKTYARVMQSTYRFLRSKGKTLDAVFWGNEQWANVATEECPDPLIIDLAMREEMFGISERHADGIIIWRLANSLHEPLGGVFTEREPFDPSSFDRMAYYPLHAPAIPGWYQEWTFDLTEPGTYELGWESYVSHATDPSAPWMKASVVLEDPATGTAEVWCETILSPAGSGGEQTGLEALGLSFSPGARLRVRLELLRSFGLIDASFQSRLADPHGLALTAADYSTGTGAKTEEIYDSAVSHFTAGAACR